MAIMEPKPAEQYDLVTPAPEPGKQYDTIGWQLVALTGCTIEEAGRAFVFLCRLGKLHRNVERLGEEIAELEAAEEAGELCNGWFVQRGDDRWYVHHTVGQECPHSDHFSSSDRIRVYVNDENMEPWSDAVERYQRLEAARVELLNCERELAEYGRFLARW